MGFNLRSESMAPASNVENLEQDQKAAARQGPAALEKFESDSLTEAVEAKQNGEIPNAAPPPASDSSSDSGSDSDSSSEDDSGGDFDFDISSDSSDSSNDDSSSDDENKDGEDDESKDEESKDSADDAEAEEKDQEEAEVKTESFRRVEPVPSDLGLRMENNFVSGLADHALQAWDAFSFVTGALAGVGIKYGPAILSGMFKVVLYTFARTFQLLGSIYDVCEQRIQRTLNSTERQSRRTKNLIEQLSKMRDEGASLPSDLSGEVFTIPLVGGTTTSSISSILKSQEDFTKSSFGRLLKGARAEFVGLEEIASNRHLGRHFDALGYLNTPPAKTIFTQAHGAPNAPDGTMYYTLGTMPAGGYQTLVNLPNYADNWPELESNYNAASFTLVGNGEGRDHLAKDPDELMAILRACESLVAANENHVVFYEELANARAGVTNTVRSLFIQLVQSKTRISFKDSVALPLFLKTSIATKVYLVAAMDIQDHNSRVIANVLAFAEKNMKLYRKPEQKE